MLNQISEFETNVTVEGFSVFCLLIQAEVEKVISEWPDKSQLLVQVTIHHDVKPEFVIAYQGDVSNYSLQALYDAITGKLDYRTRHDDLKFDISYSIDRSLGEDSGSLIVMHPWTWLWCQFVFHILFHQESPSMLFGDRS